MKIKLLRIIGIFLVTVACLIILTELLLLVTGYGLLRPWGQIWFEVHSGSLNLTQAIIQRYIAAWIWDFIFIPLLGMPAWKSLTAIALLLFVAGSLILQKIKRATYLFQ